MRWIVLLFSVALAGGCASSPPPEPVPCPRQPPPPARFLIEGTVELNLPPVMAAQAGLPPALELKLHAEAHSEALSTTPLSSHHDGHLTLVVTDQGGKQTFVNIDLTVQGDSQGTPSEGMGEVIRRFFDAASLASRPLEHLPAQGK
jgi:hypothetical protein